MPVRGRCLLEFEVEPKTAGTSNYLTTFHHFYVKQLQAFGLIEENEYFGTHALQSNEFAIRFEDACKFVLDVGCDHLRVAREASNDVYRHNQTAFHFLPEHPETFSLTVHCNCREGDTQPLSW
jgi:hypothetical protein